MALANLVVSGLQLALGYKAISAGLRGLGVTSPAKARSSPRADSARLTVQRARNFPVEARIELMRQMVRKGWDDPNLVLRFREEALKVLTRECGKRAKDGMTEWCVPATDWTAEIRAIHHAWRRRMRYTMDPRGIDFFQAPQRSLAWKAGDCGSFAIGLVWALMAVGYECMFRVVRTHGSSDWNHVFVLARKPGTQTWEWMTLDASVDQPPGWQPPDKMIAATKDFRIL